MIKRDEQYSDALHRLVGFKYPNKEVIEATVQVTEGCSLACTYCYQHDKTPLKMSFETGKKYIDVLFKDYAKTHFAVVLDFIGGEPFLEPKLIRELVDYWYYKCIMEMDNVPWYKYIRFSICSNGTEYFKPEVRELMDYISSVTSFTISIDGNKDLHDSARIHPDGRGSYDEAIAAVNDYENKYHIQLGSKMTIAPSNLVFVYSALKHYMERGATNIHANCVYEEGWTLEDAQFYYKELKRLADYKLEHYPEIYVSLFNEAWYQPNDPTDLQRWCGGNGKMIACDPQGTLYPCLRYTPSSVGHGRSDYITIGTIDTGVDEAKLKELQQIDRRTASDDECFYCQIGKGCGVCQAYCWEVNGSVNTRTKYHCQMHQAQALANVYYWNKYYQQTGQDIHFKNYVPEEWALKIIDKEELAMLYRISGEC